MNGRYKKKDDFKSNKKLIYRFKIILLIITLLFILITPYLIQKKFRNKEGVQITYPFYKNITLSKKINSIIDDARSTYINVDYEIFSVGNDYTNVFLKLTNEKITYKSYLLKNENGKETDINQLLLNDKILNQKIEEMLILKYPKFIVDGINGEGDIAYKILNNKMIIYFSNFNIKPTVTEEISIILNYHEIKDYLKFTYNLDEIYTNENIIDLDSSKKTIALTFDDGPHESYTNIILQALKDNKMNATFFMLGMNMVSYPQIVKEVIAGGNEVGNHSYSHKYLTKIKADTLDYEYNETRKVFKSITDKDLMLFRPPYGSLNEKVQNKLDTIFIKWSVDPLDWENRDTLRIKNDILNNINDGDVVLLHDIHLTTAEAIKILLPELYIRGFQVVTVSKLSELKGQEMKNNNVYRSFK